MDNKIEIYDYIVSSRTVPICPVQYLDVVISKKKCENSSNHSQLKCGNFPFAKTPVFTANLSEAQTLADNNDSKTIYHVVLEVKNNGNELNYFPGDTIGVLAQNSNKDVEFILESLGYELEADYETDISVKLTTTKKAAKVPFYVPLKTTPRQILRDCLNLRSVPKKLFCRALAEYTSNIDEKSFLETMSSKEGAQIYSKLVSNGSIMFTNLLKNCPSCKPPLSLLLEHLPRLLPRPYSIANSPLTRTNSIKLIFSILRSNPGVTTKMLEGMVFDHQQKSSPSLINIYLREPNLFRYTNEDFSKNSVLITVGCGIAPFLGFLEHKAKLMENENNRKNVGTTWLFVGNRCMEYSIYRSELLVYKSTRVLNELFESFSKDVNSNFKYVQDQMKAHAEEFVEFLTKFDATLFVCADGAEISKSIERCIKECLMAVLEQTDESVSELILQFRKNGKYREDVW